MNCQTCKDFGELQKTAASLEPRAPGIARTVNAYFVWHLSVVHGLSYQDLGVDRSSHAPGADSAASAPPQEP